MYDDFKKRQQPVRSVDTLSQSVLCGKFNSDKEFSKLPSIHLFSGVWLLGPIPSTVVRWWGKLWTVHKTVPV